jgi:hypothetical protein
MRKILYGFVLLLLLLLPTRAVAASDGTSHGRLIIGQSFTLRSGEKVDGDLVVIGGQASIEDGALVNGDVVVIGGSLHLDGETTGSAVVIGGTAALGSRAAVAADMVTLGGSLQREEGARVGGDIITNLPLEVGNLPIAAAVPAPPVPPPPKVQINLGPLARVASTFFQALALAALAMLLTAFLHPQLDRVGQAIVAQPFATGSIGLLTVLLAPITVVILAITLILIPIALAAVLLLVLAWLFGVVALGLLIGDRLTQAMHKTWEPVLSAGFGTFVLGLAVGSVYLVPCAGWLASVLVGLLGLGAAVITMFGTRPITRGALLGPAASTGAAGNTPLPPGS